MKPPGASALRSRMRSDDGASLVVVMAFVVCVGLVVTALLGYAQTGLVSAEATRSRHLLASDASAALDAAITTVRHSDYANQSAAVPCPANGMVVDGAEGPVTVVCRPEPGSGVSAGTVPISDLNRPGSAVLTLGTSGAETGLDKGSNAPLRIKGRVYVNSDIMVSGSACGAVTDPNCSRIELLENQLIAKTGCPLDKVFSDPAPDCAFSGNPPEGMDPADLDDTVLPPGSVAGHPGGNAVAAAYVQPPSGFAELPLRIVPMTCPAAGNVFELNPGYYDDARTLSNLTSTCNKPIHFTPGVYYFDFRNAEVAAMPNAHRPFTPGGQGNVWKIQNNGANAYIVGGTRKDWGASGPTAFPGACVSPLTTTTGNQGVQFVFGGSSRLEVAEGRVELCGQYATDKPALVVYGAKSDTVPAPLGLGDSTATTTATPAVASEVPFAAPDEARAAGGGVATAAVTRPPGGTTTASLRLAGTSLAGQVPPGSVLTSARLRLVHREATTRTTDQISVSVQANPTRPGPPAALTPSVSLNTTAALRTDVIDLTADLAQEVWRHGLSDLRIDYAVRAAAASGSTTTLTADLDGAQLVLEWKPPSLRSQTTPVDGSNCVGAVGGCALLSTAGNGVLLYLQGTTYAPRAWFDIRMTNVTGQVFKSGIVARALSMQITPSTMFAGPVIEVPDENGSGVSVDLELAAYVCPPSATCASAPPSAGWRRVGRTTVELESAFPIPTDGSRAVTVKSWNVLG